jgi:hypothetical protein
MPIRPPVRYVTVSCATCSWHLVIREGGVGDLLRGSDAASFLLNRVSKHCPRCGGTDLNTRTATPWERWNPGEFTRKLHYAATRKKADRD